MTIVGKIRSALVIDDSTLQRSHAVELLREIGITDIHEACDGVDALAVLDRLPEIPELFIVDLEMPNMDGIELLEQLALRKIAPGLVVASSMETSLITTVRLMTDGLQMPLLGALKKPLTSASLREALIRYSPQTTSASTKRPVDASESIDSLRAAMAAGYIRPWYQPKIDLTTGAVCGVESLARWIDPERGFIAPDRFIPVAEAGGLIFDLTLVLARQACQQVAEWNQRGGDIQLSINLSQSNLGRKGLSRELLALVTEAGMNPWKVTWEITESAMAADQSGALGTLAKLRLKGFALSIDDFGTGYSSLQQLSRMPLSELKIDKSFIKDVHEREDLRVILKSSLDMARQLKLETVAEGIETEEDLQLLRAYGCDVGQGYLFSPAIAGEKFPDWLTANQERLKGLMHVT